MSYYAIHTGKETGIYNSWEECKKRVIGYPNAKFKKFKFKKDADFFVKNGFDLDIDSKNIDNNIKNNKDLDIYNIYTDGSFIKRKNDEYCGYGIYIPKLKKKISKKIVKGKKTNNRAELMAIIKSFKLFDKNDNDILLNIYTDSEYCIKILTKTGEKYKKKNFTDLNGCDIPNKDLVIKILKLKELYNFNIYHVRSHTNKKDEHSCGNKIADELAVEGALK